MKRVLAAALCCLALAACSGPDTLAEGYRRAEKAYSEGLYLEAEALYEEYLQNAPQGEHRWAAWNRLLDISRIVKDDREKALALLEAMYLEFGSKPDKAFSVLVSMGDLHRRAGRLENAVEAWQKSIQLPGVEDVRICEVLLRLGRTYGVMAQYDLARESLRECISHSPQPVCLVSCRLELAHVHTFLENWTQARVQLEAALDSGTISDEQRSVTAFLLADVLINLEEYDRAREILESIAASHPNPRVVQTKLGQIPPKK